MPDPAYEFFAHTADTGVIARGNTLAELFTHAAQGMMEILVERSAVEPRERKSVTLREASVDDLLHAWLGELLTWFDAERFVPSRYALVTVTETQLEGGVCGERFDSARHRAGVEVKGITRHQFSVERKADGWEARIIFDV